MSISDARFWPYKPKFTLVIALALLVVILTGISILKITMKWPTEGSDNVLLIGAFLISLMPLVLALLDFLIEKGGSIEFKGVKIDFSKVGVKGISSVTVPVNIGVRGQGINDSGSTAILDTFRQAAASDIGIIDLEDGQAWWETRLLALLSGAKRLGRPEKIVFIATDAKKEQSFLGWANPAELLHCLLATNIEYKRCRLTAKAIAGQWQNVVPLYPPPGPLAAPVPPPVPPVPGWMAGNVAANFAWLAYDNATGLPNHLMEEQVLLNELQQRIEIPFGPISISITRLEDIFRSVLIRDKIDQEWTPKQQVDEFLKSDSSYMAITSGQKYLTLVSRLTLLSEAVASLIRSETVGKVN